MLRSSSLPPEASGLAGDTAAYLGQRVPDMLPGRPSVCSIESLADGVWCVATGDGRKTVVKHQLFGFLTRGKAYDLLQVEREVLELLNEAGCPVPEVLGIDEDAQCIFLQWVGDCTLDEAIQAGNRASVRWAIEGLCAIDRICTRNQDRLELRVVPVADRDALRSAWDQAGARACEGVERLFHRLERPFDAGVIPLLTGMQRWLAERSPVLGSTDYNAHNAIVDPEGFGLRFLEFAKIGWDWTERRLVQYTTSMGSGRADGRMRSLLDACAARFYARVSGRADGARALDYHRIFFLLNGAALLCSALDGRSRVASSQGSVRDAQAVGLLERWEKPDQRLRQFASMLVQGLSEDPVAVEFREEIAILLRVNGGIL